MPWAWRSTRRRMNPLRGRASSRPRARGPRRTLGLRGPPYSLPAASVGAGSFAVARLGLPLEAPARPGLRQPGHESDVIPQITSLAPHQRELALHIGGGEAPLCNLLFYTHPVRER